MKYASSISTGSIVTVSILIETSKGQLVIGVSCDFYRLKEKTYRRTEAK